VYAGKATTSYTDHRVAHYRKRGQQPITHAPTPPAGVLRPAKGEQTAMKTHSTHRYTRFTVLVVVAMLIGLAGAPLSLAAGPGSGPAPGPAGARAPGAPGAAPAAYWLQGDASNNGGAITYFNTSSGSLGGGWRFTDNTSSATTIYG